MLVLPTRQRIVQPPKNILLDNNIARYFDSAKIIISPTLALDVKTGATVNLTPVGTVYNDISYAGVGIRGDGTSGYLKRTISPGITPTEGWMVASFVYRGDAGGDIYGLYSTATTIGAMFHMYYTPTAVSCQVRWQDGGGITTFTGPAPKLGQLTTIVVGIFVGSTSLTTGSYMYVNGSKVNNPATGSNLGATTNNAYATEAWLATARGTVGGFSASSVLFGGYGFTKPKEALAQEISKNPWQIFQPDRRTVYFDFGAAGIDLSATAQSSSTASGSITSNIAISGASVALATATGVVNQTVDIAGNAASISVANGVATITTTLAGDAFNEAFATGLINQAIYLESAASATATATGAMGMTLTLAGDAIAQALASASFDASAVVLSGDAQSAAVATGALLADVALLGAAQVIVTGSGGMTHTHALESAAAVVASGSGNLVLNVTELSGSAVAEVLAGGSIQFVTQIEAHALAQVTAQMINTGIFASDRKIEKWTMRPSRNYALIAPSRNYTLAAVA